MMTLPVSDRLDSADVGTGSEFCGLSQEQESDLDPFKGDRSVSVSDWGSIVQDHRFEDPPGTPETESEQE
jgi:hypothetical protein